MRITPAIIPTKIEVESKSSIKNIHYELVNKKRKLEVFNIMLSIKEAWINLSNKTQNLEEYEGIVRDISSLESRIGEFKEYNKISSLLGRAFEKVRDKLLLDLELQLFRAAENENIMEINLLANYIALSSKQGAADIGILLLECLRVLAIKHTPLLVHDYTLVRQIYTSFANNRDKLRVIFEDCGVWSSLFMHLGPLDVNKSMLTQIFTQIITNQQQLMVSLINSLGSSAENSTQVERFDIQSSPPPESQELESLEVLGGLKGNLRSIGSVDEGMRIFQDYVQKGYRQTRIIQASPYVLNVSHLGDFVGLLGERGAGSPFQSLGGFASRENAALLHLLIDSYISELSSLFRELFHLLPPAHSFASTPKLLFWHLIQLIHMHQFILKNRSTTSKDKMIANSNSEEKLKLLGVDLCDTPPLFRAGIILKIPTIDKLFERMNAIMSRINVHKGEVMERFVSKIGGDWKIFLGSRVKEAITTKRLLNGEDLRLHEDPFVVILREVVANALIMLPNDYDEGTSKSLKVVIHAVLIYILQELRSYLSISGYHISYIGGYNMSVLLSCLLENISEILHCVGGEILNINCIHKWQTLLIFWTGMEEMSARTRLSQMDYEFAVKLVPNVQEDKSNMDLTTQLSSLFLFRFTTIFCSRIKVKIV